MLRTKNKVNIKFIKYNDKEIILNENYKEIDAELAIAINYNLKAKMKQRRLEKYKVSTSGQISKYHNAIAIYEKRYCTKCKPKNVLISVFRIAKDYIQENYIIDNKIDKITYYKIIRME